MELFLKILGKNFHLLILFFILLSKLMLMYLFHLINSLKHLYIFMLFLIIIIN